MLTIGLNHFPLQLEDLLVSSSKTIGSSETFKASLDAGTKEMLDHLLFKLENIITEINLVSDRDFELLLKGNVELILTYQKGSLWFQQKIDCISIECINLIFNEVRII